MEGHLLMSQRERERLKLFERVKRGELSLRDAAAICGLSYRETRRLFKRYRECGDGGLVHEGRGRPSNRTAPAEFKANVLARYQERYPTLGQRRPLRSWRLMVTCSTMRRCVAGC